MKMRAARLDPELQKLNQVKRNSVIGTGYGAIREDPLDLSRPTRNRRETENLLLPVASSGPDHASVLQSDDVLENWVWLPHKEHAYIPAKLAEETTAGISFRTMDGEVITLGSNETESLVAATENALSSNTENLLNMHAEECSIGAVLHQLRVRYRKDAIYTSLGGILISINPFKMLPIYTSHSLRQYELDEAGNTDGSPHVFGVAANAYKGLTYDFVNQSIVISGESGSGKTEATKLVLQYLSHVSGVSNSLGPQLLQATSVLESFGNAKTVTNHNSSRFGKWIDVKFRQGSICGGELVSYLLERTRVIGQAPGERNFHIFYQVCDAFLASGDSIIKKAEEEISFIKSMKLKSVEQYNFLSGDSLIDGIDDGWQLIETLLAMEQIGFSLQQRKALLSVIGGILELGNVTPHADPEGTAAIPMVSLESAASLLGLDEKELGKALMFRSVIIGADETDIPLSITQSKEARDALAKSLYSKLFDWIVYRVNVNLSGIHSANSDDDKNSTAKDKSSFHEWRVSPLRPEVSAEPMTVEEVPVASKRLSMTGGNTRVYRRQMSLAAFDPVHMSPDAELSIGILDIFGFEVFQTNSLEQFFINYANEKLQQHFYQHTFTKEEAEYADEGISAQHIEFSDNRSCLDLIEERKLFTGVMKMLDEEAVVPKGSDQTFLTRMFKLYEPKMRSSKEEDAPFQHFKRCLEIDGFKIQHYAGQVTYNVDGFVAKNKDKLYEKLERLLVGSRLPLVSHMYSSADNEDDEDAKDGSHMEGKQQVTDATQGLSGNGLTSGGSGGASSIVQRTLQREQEILNRKIVLKQHKSASATVANRFQQQLSTLMRQIKSTEPHFIRCIKPNDKKQACNFDANLVLTQMRYSGLFEALRIRRLGYPFRRTHHDFYSRYGAVAVHLYKQILGDAAENTTFPSADGDAKAACQWFVDILKYVLEQHRGQDAGPSRLLGFEAASLLNSLDLEEIQIGKTKVFWTYSQSVIIEGLRTIAEEHGRERAVARTDGNSMTTSSVVTESFSVAASLTSTMSEISLSSAPSQSNGDNELSIYCDDDDSESRGGDSGVDVPASPTVNQPISLYYKHSYRDATRLSATAEPLVLKNKYTGFLQMKGVYQLRNDIHTRKESRYLKGVYMKRSSLKQMRFVHQLESIPNPLLELPDESSKTARKELAAHAVNAFDNVLFFMRDKFHAYPVTCGVEVVETGLHKPLLRDEIYAQIVKQTTDNPSEESVFFGWRLLFVCLLAFPPRNMDSLLLSHLASRAAPSMPTDFTTVSTATIEGLTSACFDVLMGYSPSRQNSSSFAEGIFCDSFPGFIEEVFKAVFEGKKVCEMPFFQHFGGDGELAVDMDIEDMSSDDENVTGGPATAPSKRLLEPLVFIALHKFKPRVNGQLKFRKGDLLKVWEAIPQDPNTWVEAELQDQIGDVPLNYLKPFDPETDGALLNRRASVESVSSDPGAKPIDFPSMGAYMSTVARKRDTPAKKKQAPPSVEEETAAEAHEESLDPEPQVDMKPIVDQEGAKKKDVGVNQDVVESQSAVEEVFTEPDNSIPDEPSSQQGNEFEQSEVSETTVVPEPANVSETGPQPPQARMSGLKPEVRDESSTVEAVVSVLEPSPMEQDNGKVEKPTDLTMGRNGEGVDTPPSKPAPLPPMSNHEPVENSSPELIAREPVSEVDIVGSEESLPLEEKEVAGPSHLEQKTPDRPPSRPAPVVTTVVEQTKDEAPAKKETPMCSMCGAECEKVSKKGACPQCASWDTPIRRRNGSVVKPCAVVNCTKARVSRGYCSQHANGASEVMHPKSVPKSPPRNEGVKGNVEANGEVDQANGPPIRARSEAVKVDPTPTQNHQTPMMRPCNESGGNVKTEVKAEPLVDNEKEQGHTTPIVTNASPPTAISPTETNKPSQVAPNSSSQPTPTSPINKQKSPPGHKRQESKISRIASMFEALASKSQDEPKRPPPKKKLW